MINDNGEVKRYRIIKRIRRCYLHKDVRTSICLTIRVQIITKDLKPVWRQIEKG